MYLKACKAEKQQTTHEIEISGSEKSEKCENSEKRENLFKSEKSEKIDWWYEIGFPSILIGFGVIVGVIGTVVAIWDFFKDDE